ncbi:DUF6445 family protein [Henriciella sp.]|uniref:DUF6445 family protein n=1 Tax=Henriciella sp. TaxID=1968823 RepID=UPI0026362C79|nr:DUF6445 family protein [Henriciella sp.]
MQPDAGSQPQVRLEEIGRERNPVIIIDQAIPGAGTLIDTAASQGVFSRRGPYYPGVRTPGPRAYVDAVGRTYGGLICDVFGWQSEGMQPAGCDFSLVTTPPEELVLYQRLPHIDGTSPDLVAILHYLCGPETGGTGFFRHVATGYESLTAERHAGYTESLKTELAETGEPPARYPGASPHFERVRDYACTFNRILVYRGNLLHSGLIPEDLPLSDDPRTGRLTLNTFFQRGPRGA